MTNFSPVWLDQLAKYFSQAGFKLYLVGGAIRDQLLNRPFAEWDLATNAQPDQTEAALRRYKVKNIGVVGKKFGTLTAELKGERVEITTFRADQYSLESRKPLVSFGRSIEEDLSRRDFTINAIAFDLLLKKLIDPFRGQADLEQKTVRAVGEARDRFNEDPLRMLRAVRLATVLDFTIEPTTLGAISLEKERLAIISSERIAQELDKLLLAEKPSQGIRLLVETGLINYILPELIPAIDLEFDPREHKDIYEHILQVLDQSPASLALRWTALLHDIAKPLTRRKIEGEYRFLGHEVQGAKIAKVVLGRLKYPKDFIDYVSQLVYLHQRLPQYDGSWNDGAVRRFVRDAGLALKDLFAFAEADQSGRNERKLELYRRNRQQLRERIEELERQAEIAKITSPLSGDELMKIFHRPAGPWIKPVKEHLLSLVLDGQLEQKDQKEAEKIARAFLKQKE